MGRLFVLASAIVLAVVSVTASPQGLPGPSPRNASYTLKAILDPASHMIHGSGKLTWRNISKNATSELQLHLYWNAWRDEKSSWMREQALGRNAAMLGRPAEDRSMMDVTTISIAGQNLTAANSQIKDTDMAAEMVNYTQSSILSQAGTAMLAQANQSGQGILKLLTKLGDENFHGKPVPAKYLDEALAEIG